jgi:nucleoside-diphosphate-sugar epimerase
MNGRVLSLRRSVVKFFIAGATGVLGRGLVGRLAARGGKVAGLARTPSAGSLIRSLGGQPVHVDLYDTAALARAIEGADVVIHAATAIPPGIRARFRRAWSENDRIRREGTRALVKAAAAAGARLYLQQSVAWVVKSSDGSRAYDENVTPEAPALVQSAVDGEHIAREIGDRRGLRVGVLRAGAFYGPAASRAMAAVIRKGWMPIPGNGDSLVAPIHEEDMVSAVVAAAEAGAAGIWHVVDDERVTLAGLLRHLARVLGAPQPPQIPTWRARLLLGGHVLESLTTSANTSNAKIRRELGWTPAFPTYRDGIADMVAAWQRQGAPARSARVA